MTLLITDYCLIHQVNTNTIVQERNSGDISANNATHFHTSILTGATSATIKKHKLFPELSLHDKKNRINSNQLLNAVQYGQKQGGISGSRQRPQ